jgi:hypothetical protein
MVGGGSLDIQGLVTEAPTLDALVDRVAAVVPDLLAANGQLPAGSISLRFSTTREIQAA